MVEDRKIFNSKTLTFFPDITHTHTHTENVIPKSHKPSGARQKPIILNEIFQNTKHQIWLFNYDNQANYPSNYIFYHYQNIRVVPYAIIVYSFLDFYMQHINIKQ